MAKQKGSNKELPEEFKRFNELVEYVRSQEMKKTNGVHVPDVKIADLAGYNLSAFSMMKNNKDKKVSSFMPKAAKNLCARYPECSLDYVLNGTGSLLNQQNEGVLIIDEEADMGDIFPPRALGVQGNPDTPDNQEKSECSDNPDIPVSLSAREKWELAAAEYGLSYDPDDMMARDTEGKIHLFVEEGDEYMEKIYAKGIKIRELSTALPERSVQYRSDKKLHTIEKQFTIDIKSDVWAYSEADAYRILEAAVQEEIEKMKLQFEALTTNEE